MTVVAVIALVATGCGGDDDADDVAGEVGEAADIVAVADDEGDAVSEAAEDVVDDALDDADAALEDAADSIGASTGGDGETFALVTVDGETYEFDETSACIGLSGAVGGGFQRDNYADEFRFDLPPADWEAQNDGGQDWPAPSVQLLLGAGGSMGTAEDYHSDEAKAAASVTSFEVDGTSASGSAQVIDLDSGDPSTATTMDFEFSC